MKTDEYFDYHENVDTCDINWDFGFWKLSQDIEEEYIGDDFARRANYHILNTIIELPLDEIP